MEGIYLLLGSNLGDRPKVLSNAVELLEKNGVKVTKKSSIYETAAWGKTDQQAFLNQVIQIATDLEPKILLRLILRLEIELGRVRKEKWGERLIDIDILYYNDLILEESEIKIPHPGIPDRKFTLIPLYEICPQEIHPTLKKSQTKLMRDCKDDLEVSLYKD
ncbi:2-amino-4-hydroxy-6-hydroxymethyldihydropteridine diphosphokinase [Marivirga arenosa]|uniref:2-amino-4-hydroxy-6-hydroxymethyldihydropteridine pyrophosphokinase n=1 Tax=Marivirga arenosa TaxID=3059076 RepID=A0AA51ZXP8_9BACT|nr:2-amino-4-hydroxy-6-hydroxymethyldihydropteridine diphosphokinase [Marivirga sp. BKB1-2]WNB18693.1 2-amino-4-hydroxy-6-hydroxymethyldihydropteridine diphosphokinase [Marivirga sp. BKB1-2]